MALKSKALIKENLRLWLEDTLLREGLYRTVNVGDSTIYGADKSQLLAVSDASYMDGQVWQSAFKNWVYESGIPSPASGVAPPIVASGVSVGGTHYAEASTTGTYAHLIDRQNGRVIFDSAIPTGTLVQASFSFKEVTVDFADRFDNEQQSLLVETAYKDNPAQTGLVVYPDKDEKTLPAVWIDMIGRTNDNYELGNRSLIADYDVVFHVWSRDPYYKDLVDDVLTESEQKVIIGIDFNSAPFPLLWRNKRNPNWIQYSTYAQIWHPNSWRRMYLEDVTSQKDPPLFEIERQRVSCVVRVYPVF